MRKWACLGKGADGGRNEKGDEVQKSQQGWRDGKEETGRGKRTMWGRVYGEQAIWVFLFFRGHGLMVTEAMSVGVPPTPHSYMTLKDIKDFI